MSRAIYEFDYKHPTVARMRQEAANNWWLDDQYFYDMMMVEFPELHKRDYGTQRSILANILGHKDLVRRRVSTPHTERIVALGQALREYSEFAGTIHVRSSGFAAWLQDNKPELLPFLNSQRQWSIIVGASGLPSTRRVRAKFAFSDFVRVLDEFLSDRERESYSFPAFKQWCFEWYGSASLADSVARTLGYSWQSAKGLIFQMHNEGVLSDQKS